MKQVLKTQTQLVALSKPGSASAEAYRTLRTNIRFASLDTSLSTLLITSSSPDEGKSLTLANLGVTMAQAEQRVLLVDCDLHRPALHTLFDLPNEIGLTSIILEDGQPALPLQSTSVPGLSLLSSGPLPPRPADILGSRRMEALIARLRTEADIILFDTPPVTAVTDASILASKVDGVLLVLQAGRTRRDRVKQANQILEKAKANVIGVVLNDAQLESGYTY